MGIEEALEWVGTGTGPAGKASWMSRGSEIPRHGWGTAGLWGRDSELGGPEGPGLGIFLLIGANGVLYSLNPIHMSL